MAKEEESEIHDEVRGPSDEAPAASDESSNDEMVDSSEEEEDDDDEEAIQKVRDGFIVDDDEDSPKKRRKKHKKRRREEHNDADELDADDLELLMENSGVQSKPALSGKFKRLKRAQVDDHEDDSAPKRKVPGLSDMFLEGEEGEDEQGGEEEKAEAVGERNILDEFDDFIEEDEFSDEDDGAEKRAKLKQKQAAKKQKPRIDTSRLLEVDRELLQQLFEVFGNGAEYEWALEAQEIEDEGNGELLEPTSLDEVFEHSELKERMLTEEDNLIRIIDIPERYQKYRSTLNYIELEGEELQLEKDWIANILFKEKAQAFTGFLEQPFKEAVGKVVEFVSKDAYEVPFIWTHRRDFLLFSRDVDGENEVHKLLYEDDLWRIVQLDVEYHSLYEKRLNIEKLVEALGGLPDDDLVKDIRSLDTMVGVQDLHDYLHYTYLKEIREVGEAREAREEGEDDESTLRSRKHSKYANTERIKGNVLYDAVVAFGILAKQFGENVQDQSAKGFEVPYRIHATDDPLEVPEDLIEKLCEDDDVIFKDERAARDAVRRTFSDEIFHNPKIRAEVRATFKKFALVSVHVTDKGRGAIDAHSEYADLKYAIARTPADMVSSPDVLLRMLEAEAQGLIVVRVETKDYDNWFQCILNCLRSDGTSEIADSWNRERELVLRQTFARLTKLVALNTKEDLRRECERLIAGEVRRSLLARLDQAPYTPFGFDKGTKPNVLALSFGRGDFDSAVVGTYLRETGQMDEGFKLESNPTRGREQMEQFLGQLKEWFDRQAVPPDVIAVAGYNASTKRLFDCVVEFVSAQNITANIEDLPDVEQAPLLSVIWAQDETARLYQNSERAGVEHPPLVRYCLGLARYVQSPLLEYVSLGDNILSLSFHEHQKLLPKDRVHEAVESVFVDVVNMVGVEINEAVRDEYVAQLLPYVAGLGPRKASGLVRNINTKLGLTLANRSDLIEHELLTANIFINCASFLNIPADDASRDPLVELLDATRIHPEDYDLARKMAADALDLDEEDMAHVEEQGGIIHQLVQEGVNHVDDLNLIAYGKELETKFGKKKYATLQIIKEELVNNFEELRRSFHLLDSAEVFQMLTGETAATFGPGVVVPVTVVKVGKNMRDPGARIRFAKVVTASLILGSIEQSQIPPDTDLTQGQVAQAVVMDVFYDTFTANFSLLEEDLRRSTAPKFVKEPGKWDFEAEERDWNKERAKERAQLAKTRNIQHPLYRNLNFKQAEEYLAPQSVGDCVIRPLSKGPEFLTITWKVHNNLFQHLLVEERQSAHGKEYIVERKRYADLDQLIFQHIQAVAKKVDEMVRYPKFREGARTEVIDWLESYTKANPKSSAYVFCFDHKAPGNFLLLFKVNVNTPISTWHVRTGIDGYTLKGFLYPNMLRLCNGFKQTFKSYASSSKERYY